jgi:hypothetical protein
MIDCRTFVHRLSTILIDCRTIEQSILILIDCPTIDHPENRSSKIGKSIIRGSIQPHEQQHQQLQPPTGTNNSTNRHQQAPTTPPTACNSA